LDASGHFQRNDDLEITLIEKQTGGNSKPVICTGGKPSCTEKGGVEDQIAVANTQSWFTLEQKFSVGGKDVKVARMGADGKVALASKQVVHATANEITVTPVP